MPAVFYHAGIKFFFYSNEGNPREPIHIHARHDGKEAKFWIRPTRLAYNDGLGAKALRESHVAVEKNTDLIERSWNEFFHT